MMGCRQVCEKLASGLSIIDRINKHVNSKKKAPPKKKENPIAPLFRRDFERGFGRGHIPKDEPHGVRAKRQQKEVGEVHRVNEQMFSPHVGRKTKIGIEHKPISNSLQVQKVVAERARQSSLLTLGGAYTIDGKADVPLVHNFDMPDGVLDYDTEPGKVLELVDTASQ